MPNNSTPAVLTADTSQFRALFGKSSQVDAKLRAALRKRLRQAAQAAAADARMAALQPGRTVGKHPTSAGLRRGIAAGIKVSILTGNTRAGVVIRQDASGLTGSRRSLVRGWEAQRGWRHPVFGNRGAWAQQQGRPYFYEVIKRHQPQVTQAVEDAMRDAVASLQP